METSSLISRSGKLICRIFQHCNSWVLANELRNVQREAFTKSFCDVYSYILPSETTNQSSNQPVQSKSDSSVHMLQQKSTNVIKGTSSLIRQFQGRRVKLAYQELSLSMDPSWEDGAKNLKYILDVGRQIGERRVDSILSRSRAALMNNDAVEVGELLYGRDEPHAQKETWAEAARKQEKRVMRLVNSLPRG